MSIISRIREIVTNQSPEQKNITVAMNTAYRFLTLSTGFIPEEFDKNMSAQQTAILFAFEAGAITEACYSVGLSVSETVAITRELFKLVNSLPEDKARSIVAKVGEYIDAGYPPYESGAKAFSDFLDAVFNDNDTELILSTKKLWSLLECYNENN